MLVYCVFQSSSLVVDCEQCTWTTSNCRCAECGECSTRHRAHTACIALPGRRTTGVVKHSSRSTARHPRQRRRSAQRRHTARRSDGNDCCARAECTTGLQTLSIVVGHGDAHRRLWRQLYERRGACCRCYACACCRQRRLWFVCCR